VLEADVLTLRASRSADGPEAAARAAVWQAAALQVLRGATQAELGVRSQLAAPFAARRAFGEAGEVYTAVSSG
jgi:hypothetical protein